jgi:hypothetical protein
MWTLWQAFGFHGGQGVSWVAGLLLVVFCLDVKNRNPVSSLV